MAVVVSASYPGAGDGWHWRGHALSSLLAFWPFPGSSNRMPRGVHICNLRFPLLKFPHLLHEHKPHHGVYAYLCSYSLTPLLLPLQQCPLHSWCYREGTCQPSHLFLHRDMILLSGFWDDPPNWCLGPAPGEDSSHKVCMDILTPAGRRAALKGDIYKGDVLPAQRANIFLLELL